MMKRCDLANDINLDTDSMIKVCKDDKRRFLLSCFACDPGAGSEPFVGWQWVSRVYAGQHRVVLTRTHHHAVLHKYEGETLRFRFFDLPFCANLDHRHRLMKLYYIFWQVLVVPYAAVIIWRERITDIHHITYNAVDFPGLLWLMLWQRFIWGPVGGGQTPPEVLREYYGDGWRVQRLRSFMKRCLRYNPFVRGAIARASLVLAANSDTYRRIEPLMGKRKQLKLMLETAVVDIVARDHTPCVPLQIIWVGRFELRKAPQMIVEVARALDASHPGCFRFRMIGGGEMLEKIRAQSASCANLEVLGEVSFDQMRGIYVESDCLAFTSLQDTSGNVVLEALAYGLPVIALNHQGAADILSSGGGILIDIGPPDRVVADFAAACVRLLDAREFTTLSQQATENIRNNHTWMVKANHWKILLQTYLSL